MSPAVKTFIVGAIAAGLSAGLEAMSDLDHFDWHKVGLRAAYATLMVVVAFLRQSPYADSKQKDVNPEAPAVTENNKSKE
jgi:hypothetical protein